MNCKIGDVTCGALFHPVGIESLWVLNIEVRDKRIGAEEQECDETNPQLVGLDVVFHR